eukprot:CCRYP_013881-RA/>CCRYP_013881-RA protein AED:0.33 eAED:0.33 QI:0/-1/0/1/-1/1/1/0/421
MSGKPRRKVILGVHGGAGIILRDNLTPELEYQFRSALKEALQAGFRVLTEKVDGEPLTDVAVKAAEAAVMSMESCPLFNAGRGSVFANDGNIRMDASIMGCYLENVHPEQKKAENMAKSSVQNEVFSPRQIVQQRKFPVTPHPKAGCVAGVSNIQNPIALARQVMERTPHVMLLGKGAEEFARTLPPEVGVKFQPDEYFWTERRWKQLLAVREVELKENQSEKQTGNVMMVQLDHSSEVVTASTEEMVLEKLDEHKFGTVGCVALYRPDFNNLDGQRAQLASATSTGGMTNQRYHRVGDSPIIGAGTYANSLCAVSCTGHGEWFIRCVAAHDVVKRLEYKYSDCNDRGLALQKAVDEVVLGSLMGDGEVDSDGGDGGLIALDKDGNFVASMNCSGMYHGWIYEDGSIETRIFWDEQNDRST